VASAEARLRLAAAAMRLNAAYPHLPALILMTDEARLPDPVAAASALPKRSAVIVRQTDAEGRAALAEALAPVARECGLRLLIANDAELAKRVHADGVHFSEALAREAAHWRTRHPHWLITAAAHSAEAVMVAASSCADAAILSPLFVTASHPDRAGLGAEHFLAIARDATIPVYALGGVNADNAESLTGPNVAGIAAIDGLTA